MTEQIHETVRERYAASARQVLTNREAACCSEPGIGSELYSALERDDLPSAAVMASLGCGNPTAVADLHLGERVLDLGSGGGIDVLLSAKRVGPTGRAFGLDMTDEMLALAQRNAAEAGATNVEFLKGHIEDSLTTEQRAERGSYVGCIAGALSFSEFEAGLREVGLTGVSVTPTHSVADGMHSAIIKATKPESAVSVLELSAPVEELSLVGAGCCGGGGCC